MENATILEELIDEAVGQYEETSEDPFHTNWDGMIQEDLLSLLMNMGVCFENISDLAEGEPIYY